MSAKKLSNDKNNDNNKSVEMMKIDSCKLIKMKNYNKNFQNFYFYIYKWHKVLKKWH